MDIPQSTVKEPLKFFEWILNYNKFESYKDDFFRGYEIMPNVNIDYEKETVSYESVSDDGNGNPIDVILVVYFKNNFSKYLNDELDDFIHNFNEAVDERFLDNSYDKFIELMHIKIQEISESSKLISHNYPFVKSYITQISNHVQRKQTVFSKNNEQITITDSVQDKEDIVLEIFGFLKGKNQHGQKIMNDSNYDRLIGGIRNMIETDKLSQLVITYLF